MHISGAGGIRMSGKTSFIVTIVLALLLSACGRQTQRQNLAFDSSGGDRNLGQRIYYSSQARCFQCHGNDGSGGTYAVDIRFSAPSKIAAALRQGPGDMPQFTVSDSTILDIIAFVSEL